MKREATTVLVLVLVLVFVGILMVYSASGVGTRAAERLKNPDALYYVTRHLAYVCMGLLMMGFLVRFDYHRFQNPLVFRAIVLGTLVLLVLVLIPGLGEERSGAQRWLKTPIGGFQPSEFAKLAVIILLAVKLAQNQEHIKTFWRGFAPPLLISGVFLVLIYLEDDLGVPAVIGVVTMLMMFMAGVRWRYLMASTMPALMGLFVLIVTSPYRRARLTAFLDPWADASDSGYQLIQSLAAFAQGGIWGRGPGGSEQKLHYLPDAHTDFIYAVWSEEMGMVGSIALIVLYVALLIVALRIAACARDVFGGLLAGGIASLLAFQAAFNMAVTTGMLPTKGLPLPFVSSGGSALIAFLMMSGILINVGLQAAEARR